MSNRLSQLVSLALLLVTAGAGCKPDYLSLAEQSAARIGEGVAAAESGDPEAAVELITEAFQIGGLARGDEMLKAYRWRAICYSRMGEYQLAVQDVAMLDELNPSVADVLIVKSYVFEKQGLMSQAKRAYQRAKSLDKSVVRIRD